MPKLLPPIRRGDEKTRPQYPLRLLTTAVKKLHPAPLQSLTSGIQGLGAGDAAESLLGLGGRHAGLGPCGSWHACCCCCCGAAADTPAEPAEHARALRRSSTLHLADRQRPLDLPRLPQPAPDSDWLFACVTHFPPPCLLAARLVPQT